MAQEILDINEEAFKSRRAYYAKRAMKYVFIALVKFYRRFISPLKPPCCRFTPTCSEYALTAFKERGAIVGFGLTMWRILRYNPFCKAGYDPVPPRKKRKSKKENKDTEYLTDKANGQE